MTTATVIALPERPQTASEARKVTVQDIFRENRGFLDPSQTPPLRRNLCLREDPHLRHPGLRLHCLEVRTGGMRVRPPLGDVPQMRHASLLALREEGPRQVGEETEGARPRCRALPQRSEIAK